MLLCIKSKRKRDLKDWDIKLRVLELFRTITSIPRCSGTYEPFVKFIQEFAKTYGYICEIDNFHNILCYKNSSKPKLCLQSHYDIVCLEKNIIPSIIEDDGFLKAKNSTLGADNGIGCAYMLALMEQNIECEFLFTSDEEIGLIGANNIELNLSSSYMLNLDSETQGEICIGCAGGVDIFGINTNSKYVENKQNATLYELETVDLAGGHSGVDIDKNIPNGIKLIFDAIKSCDGKLLDIQAGQRINAIPTKAKAIIVANSEPKSSQNLIVTKVETDTKHHIQLDDNIIEFITNFQNGVLEYDKNLDVVLTSINLAIVENSSIDGVKISISARSMINEELEKLKELTIKSLEKYNFTVSTDGKYPAWKPEQSAFTNDILNIYKKHIPNTNLKAIHAGLECAIFKDKYTNIQICSIGPNIYFPHSNNEKCEIKSVKKVYDILVDIVKTIQPY